MRMIFGAGVLTSTLGFMAAFGSNPVRDDPAGASSANRTSNSNAAWSEPIEVASGGGYRGPWRANRSEWDFVDDPTVAINDDGFIGVAWAYHPSRDLLFQMYLPDGTPRFDEPINVTQSPDVFSWLPRMIISEGDDAEEITVYVNRRRGQGAVDIAALAQRKL